MSSVDIVLAGARGHGRWHLENIRRLQDKGVVRLAGICELTPLTARELPEGLGTPEQSADFGALLDSTGARIAVICTPIQTHTDLALEAARRRVHLLLEKPPAPSYAEFRRMAEGVAEAGIACQIGFQSLGSQAVPAIRRMIAEGAIGRLAGIGGAGAWARAESYYRRAPWAGRRRLNGVDVIDGALTNPLAHAVATALALGGTTRAEHVTHVETELLRANDIESDDTSCVHRATRSPSPPPCAPNSPPSRMSWCTAAAAGSPSGTSRTGCSSSAPATAPRSPSTAAPTCWRTWSGISPTATTCWSPRRRPAPS
jgi:predicted dehydrogenase